LRKLRQAPPLHRQLGAGADPENCDRWPAGAEQILNSFERRLAAN